MKVRTVYPRDISILLKTYKLTPCGLIPRGNCPGPGAADAEDPGGIIGIRAPGSPGGRGSVKPSAMTNTT